MFLTAMENHFHLASTEGMHQHTLKRAPKAPSRPAREATTVGHTLFLRTPFTASLRHYPSSWAMPYFSKLPESPPRAQL